MNILNDMTQIQKYSVPAATSAEHMQNAKKQQINKADALDIFCDKFVKKRDITDTVTMPRAIFKGYLCFTAGTAINAIGGMLKKSKFSKALAIAGSLISIYGTFNFVKPFLVKEKELTNEKK